MTAKEFATIMLTIKSAYPAFKITPDEDSKTVWYKILQGCEYDRTKEIALEYIKTNKFPPSIADLMDVQKPLEPWCIDWAKLRNNAPNAELSREGQLAVKELGRSYIDDNMENSKTAVFCRDKFAETYNRFHNTPDGQKESLMKLYGISQNLIEQKEDEKPLDYWSDLD